MSEVTAIPFDNAQAFTELLSTIAQTSLTQRDKGTRFEKLMLDYLTNEPTYEDQFDSVQLYTDWALEHPELECNAKDIGIDLVGSKTMGGGMQLYCHPM